MRIYNRAWCAFWSLITVIGLGLTVLEWTAIGAILTLGLLCVLCQLVRHLLPDVVPGWRSLTVAIAILTVVAFCRVSPPLGLLVVLTAILSFPAVVSRAIGSARRSTKADAVGKVVDATLEDSRPEAPEAESRLTLPEAMGPLNGLDDRQLCRLWRESFWILREPAPSGTVLCLVALREACLDELERRDAAALQAWLRSGTRASSGPEKFMADPPGGGSDPA